MPRHVAVVRTGTANLASVLGALRRLGLEPITTDDATAVEQEDLVVFPGVGSFGAIASLLAEEGLGGVLRKRITAGRPTLGICLGMQVLFERSEESPGASGLGVVHGDVRRFTGDIRVPQMGWNRVEAEPNCDVLRSGWAYFANSYRAIHRPAGWMCAIADHGGPFIAAIERGRVVACQFHPELSGVEGRRLLERWVERSREGVSS